MNVSQLLSDVSNLSQQNIFSGPSWLLSHVSSVVLSYSFYCNVYNVETYTILTYYLNI